MKSYSLLGRSGLRVSPLCLGTMTFGTEWGWGAPEDESKRMLDRYVESGGNFVDTADLYTNGASERFIGAWLKERGARDRVVVATKYSFADGHGNPNNGGNGRKNLLRALEGSLRRLGTDYVDLYWVHAWDGLTPIDEIMRSLDDAVRAGKVRHVGLSNAPAWITARAQTLAELRGWEPLCALQLEYSLVERHIELEHVPMARELGLGITPWSPLGSGMLTGKHRRGSAPNVVDGEGGRLKVFESSTHPGFRKLYTERNWRVVDVLVEVAKELGRSPAQIAIAWTLAQPAVTSTILGARHVGQLEDNLRAADVAVPPALMARLDEVSRVDVTYPYMFSGPEMRGMLSGGVDVRR